MTPYKIYNMDIELLVTVLRQTGSNSITGRKKRHKTTIEASYRWIYRPTDVKRFRSNLLRATYIYIMFVKKKKKYIYIS